MPLGPSFSDSISCGCGPCCYELRSASACVIISSERFTMIRVGTGFDAHRFVSGRPLVVGGVTIAHEQGLDGHSDADVLCHAVIDALLGAIAEGDIGKLFPDDDNTWKDADSIELMKRVMKRVVANNSVINNVDATIVAERPRMAGHIDAMRQRIADALGIDLGQVSVKATTQEGMGALGRGEGIAAMAVATVQTDAQPRAEAAG